MKRNTLLAAVLCGLLVTGCAGKLANLGRVWPDGASVRMIKPQLTASGTALSITAEEISWRGTNGFPYGESANQTLTAPPLKVVPNTPVESRQQWQRGWPAAGKEICTTNINP